MLVSRRCRERPAPHRRCISTGAAVAALGLWSHGNACLPQAAANKQLVTGFGPVIQPHGCGCDWPRGSYRQSRQQYAIKRFHQRHPRQRQDTHIRSSSSNLLAIRYCASAIRIRLCDAALLMLQVLPHNETFSKTDAHADPDMAGMQGHGLGSEQVVQNQGQGDGRKWQRVLPSMITRISFYGVA